MGTRAAKQAGRLPINKMEWAEGPIGLKGSRRKMPDSSMLLKARMILKLVPLLVLIALVQPASAFQIRRVVSDSGVVLRLRGNVTAGDYRRLKTILQNGSVVGLEIRSRGGSVADGLALAPAPATKRVLCAPSQERVSVRRCISFSANG